MFYTEATTKSHKPRSSMLFGLIKTRRDRELEAAEKIGEGAGILLAEDELRMREGKTPETDAEGPCRTPEEALLRASRVVETCDCN